MSQTVLVADDSQTIRKIITMALKAEPFEVIGVGDIKGLMREAKLRPSVILLDYHMPDANGYDACLALKTNQQTSDIPIVMLGGSYKEFDEARAIQCGADQVLMKPFTTDELFHALGSALQSQAKPYVETPPTGAYVGTEPTPAPPVSAPPISEPYVETAPTVNTVTPMAMAAQAASAPQHEFSAHPVVSESPAPGRVETFGEYQETNSRMAQEPHIAQEAIEQPPIEQSRPIAVQSYTNGDAAAELQSSDVISLNAMSEEELKEFISEEIKNTVREQLPSLLRNVMGEVFQQKVLPKLLKHGEERLETLFKDELENRINQRVRLELERLLGVE